MFGAFKRMAGAVAGSITREVKAEYGESKDFLEAVCAGAALVAYADGELEEAERKAIVALIQNNPTLGKIYQSAQIEQVAADMFRRAQSASGRQGLARELDDLKGRPNAAQMADDVYLICLDIANADGELEAEEEVVLKKLASRLGVDPSKFDF